MKFCCSVCNTPLSDTEEDTLVLNKPGWTIIGQKDGTIKLYCANCPRESDGPRFFRKDNQPYLTEQVVDNRKWNPDYPAGKICKCGHPYYRHFDWMENHAPVGCKYCQCDTFNPAELLTVLDNLVNRWHSTENTRGRSLQEWIGMSDEQYQVYSRSLVEFIRTYPDFVPEFR